MTVPGVVAWVLALAVAAVLIVSAVAKFLDRTPAAKVAASWRLLGVPRALATPATAGALPAVELVIGVGVLVPGAAGRVFAVLAAILFAAFLAVVIRARATKSSEPCHCFGAGSAPVDSAALARNAGFVVLALATVLARVT